jgi:hypothetical protein
VADVMDFKSGSSMAKGQPIEAVAKTVQPSAAMLSRQTDLSGSSA